MFLYALIQSQLSSGFQKTTRDAIPGWNGLLFVYGVLLIPVLFSLLIGINLLVWSRSRINYVFIFGMNSRQELTMRDADKPFQSWIQDHVWIIDNITRQEWLFFPLYLLLTIIYRLRAFYLPDCLTPFGYHSSGSEHRPWLLLFGH
jgi:hypothetical protein